MADRGDLEQESEAERHLYREGFPAAHKPDCQVWITPSIRVDFLYLALLVVVEYLGKDHELRLEHDATRSAVLQRLGYLVIAVTAAMTRDMAAVSALIATSLDQRLAQQHAGILRAPVLIEQPPRLSALRTLRGAAPGPLAPRRRRAGLLV